MRRLVLALLLGGCASAEVVDSAKRPLSYEEVVRARLDTVVEVREHTLRYNPAGCRCPAFEIALGPHWQRVRLAVDDTSDPTLVALLEASRHATDQTGRTYIVAGTLTDLVDRCGAGTAVVSLEPTAFMGAKIRETPRSPP